MWLCYNYFTVYCSRLWVVLNTTAGYKLLGYDAEAITPTVMGGFEYMYIPYIQCGFADFELMQPFVAITITIQFGLRIYTNIFATEWQCPVESCQEKQRYNYASHSFVCYRSVSTIIFKEFSFF